MTDKCLIIRVYGVVQGVGFRPFIHNLAVRHGISGNVCNKGPFVEIKAQGGERMLAAFLHAISSEAPARARIDRIETEPMPATPCDGFSILQSGQSEGAIYPSPDIAVCEDCVHELFDPSDRRYLHPFINCTACGPRLTILDTLPYDRAGTSMAEFPLCARCADEYEDTHNRRYHAQPVCCNDCGPTLNLIASGAEKWRGQHPIAAARDVIRSGGIVAVKGIGGFHLCCDAANEQTVSRLRRLKNRPAKPFAVMARNLETAKCLCALDEPAQVLLDSPQKPIVLLQKKETDRVCEQVAPGLPQLGLMLPYAPLQLLLFEYPDWLPFPDCLVMTSGNVGGEPICISEQEAVSSLADLSDLILSHNRAIRVRADDSVLSVYHGLPYMLRRSRGYAPLPVHFQTQGVELLSIGGELKNAFCLAKGGELYLSPHIGDLSDENCVRALDETYARFKRLLRVEPKAVACDPHPGYNATAYAKSLGLSVIEVQHHFAHIASCMAENGLDGEVLGVAFDGTGYGPDGTVWGGEFLVASYSGYTRLASIAPFPLAGGDAASREGYRPALGVLTAVCGEQKAKAFCQTLSLCSVEQESAQLGMIKSHFNCVTTTSAGRLFDAAAAILGIKSVSTYEGEAASALEASAIRYAVRTATEQPRFLEGSPALNARDTNAIIETLAVGRLNGEPADKLAFIFHAALAQFIQKTSVRCREQTGLSRVVLSGGVFQNHLLLSMCEERLREAGFLPYIHSLVPCSDGGLALGQAAVAVSQIMC